MARCVGAVHSPRGRRERAILEKVTEPEWPAVPTASDADAAEEFGTQAATHHAAIVVRVAVGHPRLAGVAARREAVVGRAEAGWRRLKCRDEKWRQAAGRRGGVRACGGRGDRGRHDAEGTSNHGFSPSYWCPR